MEGREEEPGTEILSKGRGPVMKIGNRQFDTDKHTYVMGILNVTPDSFSDGGRYDAVDRALYRVEEMIKQGADIIDIGGESTRPGYEPISEEEEIDRVTPVIESIKSRFDVPVSLDTYKGKVAQAGVHAGADMLNDIWGLKKEPLMARVIGEAGIPCCLMHNREKAVYQNFRADVLTDLKESLALAENAGIGKEQIILDPGVGFGKTYEQNLEVLRHLEELHVLGFPILLGCSRKSVIGLTLDLPVEERLEGTLMTTALAVQKGCGFVRVHDVEANVRAVKMAEALWRA